MAQSQAMPAFIFRLMELRERPGILSATDRNGHWEPAARPGCYCIVAEGATGLWWFCDGQGIQQVHHERLLNSVVHYSTFSLFYSDGRGFSVLRGDATKSTFVEPWLPLCFEHDETDHSSYLTNARAEPALYRRRTDQKWVRMLLPDIHHGSNIVQDRHQGALKGELPILLGLLAFAIPIDSLEREVPSMYRRGQWQQCHNGEWQQYCMASGRTHKRGLVVEVYAYSTPNEGSTKDALESRETGVTGKYYY